MNLMKINKQQNDEKSTYNETIKNTI